MIKILILEGHAIQVLPFLEAFAKMPDVEVTIFCDSILSYGWFSRYSNKKVKAPKLQGNYKRYHTFTCDYLSNHTQDIIIPMANESAEYASKYKDELEKFNCVVEIQPYNIFNKANDKEILMDLCRDLGIPHPRTANPFKVGYDEAVKYVGDTFLIKPNISYGARGIRKVKNDECLKSIFEKTVETFGGSCIQEFIPQTGMQYKVQLYRDESGEIIFASCYEKTRYYPIDGGTSTCNVVVDKTELYDQYAKILNELNWVGVADFDCIEDPRDGVIKLMEINPRVPGTIKATFISGINVAEVMLARLLNRQYPRFRYNSGCILRNFSTEILWFVVSPNRWKTLPNWFKFFNKNTYYADGSHRDPLPFLGGFLGGVSKMLSPEFIKQKKKD